MCVLYSSPSSVQKQADFLQMILTYERSEDGKQPHVEQKCKVFLIKGLI